MELNYFIVDVFTDTALKGNPLAVVMNTAALTTERMQAIAREFNLSETTFVERRAADVEKAQGVRVRIFTTQEELNFAGHPTLGTASVLRLEAPEVVATDTVTLKLNVGPIPVKFSGVGLFGEMTQRDPEFGEELDRVEVARLMGLRGERSRSCADATGGFDGNRFCSCCAGISGTAGAARVRQHEATAWLRERGARWFYVLAPTGEDTPRYRARMQFNGGEDPATGSAAGCAIAYLVRHGAVEPGERIVVRQGVEMGRESDLFLSAQFISARVSEVRVAGSTVLVAKGQLFLP